MSYSIDITKLLGEELMRALYERKQKEKIPITRQIRKAVEQYLGYKRERVPKIGASDG